MNHKRVLRLLREDNLLCLRKKAFVPATTDSRHGWKVYPNLARRLVPTTINQLWVADITYIRLAEAFVYLAVVLDAYSRRMVGWAMADHLRAELALAALQHGAGQPRGGRRAAWSITPTAASSTPAATTWQLLERTRDPAEHEPAGLPVRQRDGGELHEDAQAGGGRRPASIAIWPMRTASIGSVHRRGLQSATAALGAGLSGAGRVRGDHIEARGCCAAAPGRCGNRLSLIPCLSLGVQSNPDPESPPQGSLRRSSCSAWKQSGWSLCG